MRRSLPWLATMVAVLLFVQWAGAAPACLASSVAGAGWLGAALCHSGGTPDPAPQQPGHHGGMDCPACAALHAGLLPAAPLLSPPAIVVGSAPPPLLLVETPTLDRRVTPQQPRAPPTLS